MAAPLIPQRAAVKSDSYIGPNAVAHADRVERAKSVDAALNAFRPLAGEVRKSGTQPAVRSSNGRGQLLAGAMPDNAPAPTIARKVDAAMLHPRVRAIAANLPVDAANLLDLVVRAHEHYRGGQLIEVSSSDAAKALGVTKQEAEDARSLLEMRGLLNFFDNHSGDRGFRPSTSF